MASDPEALSSPHKSLVPTYVRLLPVMSHSACDAEDQDRLRRRERASEWPLMPTVRGRTRPRWVSLRRSRLEHAAVEVAVVFRTPMAGTSTVA
jgi:hypothetical protein